MKYTVHESEGFSVIGQEIELTNSQNNNLQISMQFWRKFNSALKKSYLSQSGNWIKYAFMERRNGTLYYFCAIPKRSNDPDGFICKEIPPYQYLVVEHVGSMDNIYKTYEQIYRELLPDLKYVPLQENFLHFERYNDQFHWNSENSIIEIWLPIQG